MLDKIKEYSAQIIMAALFVAGWIGHGMYSDSITKAIAETRVLAAESAAKEISRISVNNTTIQGKIVERIRTEQVYSECKHSPDSFELVKEAFK